MDIRDQLQEVHLGNSAKIQINYETAKTMNLSDICIIMAENCELILDADITDHINSTTKCRYKILVTKNFENIQVVLMLFIIYKNYAQPYKYFVYDGKRIIFDHSEFMKLAEYFGVSHLDKTKDLIRTFSRPFEINPESDNNIKNYLGLLLNQLEFGN